MSAIILRVMNNKTNDSDLTQTMHRIYSREIGALTPEADALFTTDGTYSALEKVALGHQDYFERARSPLYTATRAAANNAISVGMAALVGGAIGLAKGLYQRDIIEQVTKGLRYGAALGAINQGARHAINLSGIIKDKDLANFLRTDEFFKDPNAVMQEYRGIEDKAATDPVHLGRLFTLVGAQDQVLSSGRLYKECLDVDSKLLIQGTGASYALMELVVNNIIRGDFLNYKQAATMGALTYIANIYAQERFKDALICKARDSVKPVFADKSPFVQDQIVGGLVQNWYGKAPRSNVRHAGVWPHR